jgi:coenzyme Q-binding protein COQ10
MPQHHEKRILPYAPTTLFDLVADVESYPEFLPWCVGTRINWRRGNQFNADVMIGYKAIRERFTSTVTLTPHERVEVTYENGPFSHLQNSWRFRPITVGGALHCEIEFFIEFEFQSKMLASLIEIFFTEAVRRMIDAFESHARTKNPA